MKAKMFEIRDRGTRIPVIAIKTHGDTPQEHSHFRSAGWGTDSVIVVKHNGGTQVAHDPFKWREDGTRTMFEAHRHIQENFDTLENFAVIDVEYILGETAKPKASEIL